MASKASDSYKNDPQQNLYNITSGHFVGGSVNLTAMTTAAAVSAQTHHNPWGIFWLVWGIVGGIVELYALHRKAQGDTLSEQVWWLRGPVFNSWRGFSVLAIMVWLTLHFAFKLFS